MSYLQRLGDINTKYGMFHAMTGETDAGDSKFLFSAKDNLTSLDMETCAGSRILQGYVPAFDAAAIEKMKAAGGMLVGKTNMDEFGFGTFSANSAYEIPRNPFDRERSCGGSSGGSACAAAVLEEMELTRRWVLAIVGDEDTDGDVQQAAPSNPRLKTTGTTKAAQPAKAQPDKKKWLTRCLQLKAQCMGQGVKESGLDSWYQATFGDVEPGRLTLEQVTEWGHYLAQIASDSNHSEEDK